MVQGIRRGLSGNVDVAKQNYFFRSDKPGADKGEEPWRNREVVAIDDSRMFVPVFPTPPQ